MTPSTHMRGFTLAAATLGLALIAAACSSRGTTPTVAPGSSAGSGSGVCQTAPSPPDKLAGWGPPATAPDITPVLIANAGELVCGANRVLFTILDKSGTPIGAPDRTVKISIYDLGRDHATPIATKDGTFVWAIQDVRGIYVINTSFPDAGTYGAEFTTSVTGGQPTTLRLTFDVQPTSPVVKVGDHAPASKTPTLADVGGDPTHISTDATPDADFYKTSVDQAVAAHKPFVLIFATPKFCTSAQCGPTLDRIKPFATRYPGVTFINVEPYKLKPVDGVLQPDLDANGQLQTVAATDEWHLFSEPNVFVVSKDGIVTANFELIFSDAELTAALEAVK